MKFAHRREAGEELAAKLTGNFDLVLAIPRGGVVIGKAVADRLGLPLAVVVTKKVGAPGQEELAVGAMNQAGEVIWDEDLLMKLGLDKTDLAAQIQKAKSKIKNYQLKFKIKDLDLRNKAVVLVDDGIATGATMKAAILYLRATRYAPQTITVAAPVCAYEAYQELESLADEVVCLYLAQPGEFGAVGQFYEYFPQVTDDEVVAILGR